MKKTTWLLLCLCSLFLFSSCKKDSDSDSYYFRIYQDGAWKTYPQTAGEYGPDLLDPSLYDMVVRGQNQNGTDIFDLTLQRPGAIPAGTYHTDNYVDYWADLNLIKINGSDLSSWGVNDAPSMPPSKYSIIITSITDDAITGSFSGNYLHEDFSGSTPPTLNITQGEFRVKRID
jgi:hypothetical protein